MSFGFSVGDFITVLDLVKQASKRFQDAPRQYASISEDLRNFSNVIQDIRDLESECGPETKDQERLHKIADESTRLVNDLLSNLDKYQDIKARPLTITQKFKKPFKRLTWDQSGIPESRGRMLLYLELLISLRQQVSSQRACRIEQGVLYLSERSNQQERDDILDWIGTVDHSLRQSDFFDQHVEGTGEWLLVSREFQKWLTAKGGRLICVGIPGAGKTFLASIAIQRLLDLFGNDSNTGIAYYYCDFRQQSNESIRTILSCVLRKLVECSSCLPQAIKDMYKEHKRIGNRPSLPKIKEALKAMTSFYPRCFIVIDGLDECLVWRDVMDQLRLLPGANILATSRDSPEIVNDLVSEEDIRLEVHAPDADLRRYLDHYMTKVVRVVKSDQQLAGVISNSIIAASGGMFLLAHLHLESLRGKMSFTSLKSALAALSTGASSYDKAYNNTMIRIESQPEEEAAIAKDVLAWLTFANRPLKIEELPIAVILQEADSNIDRESLIGIEILVSVCAGLVRIDKTDNSVSLIHSTTKEYLKRRLFNWRQGPNAAIATICVTYLLFPMFDVEFSKLEEYLQPNKAGVQLQPLLGYSLEYMTLHSHLAVIKPPCMDRFLSSGSKITSNWLLLGSKHGYEHMENIAGSLIERGVYIDVHDREGRSILHYAVINGWKLCVRLLLDRGASLEPDIDNMTPLHYTVNARADGEYIAKTFINAGIPIDTPVTRRTYIPKFQDGKVVYTLKDSDMGLTLDLPTTKAGLTALHLAALTGSQRMTKFFLDHGANPNFRSESGETPLHLALKLSAYGPQWPGIVDFWNEPENRVECILDYIGLNDDEDEDEFASSHEWIRETRLAIIDLLLDSPDVDVNAQDDFGISPFHIAAQKEYSFESVAEKLINKGARISLRTEKNKTPLQFAVASRNGDFVSKLLELGADPTERDIDGLNALHYAAKKRHLPIFEEILNRIPISLSQRVLESKDNSGQNLLHHLLDHGFVNVDFVSYLLKRVGGINDFDRAGKNPMAVFLSAFALWESFGLFVKSMPPQSSTTKPLTRHAYVRKQNVQLRGPFALIVNGLEINAIIYQEASPSQTLEVYDDV
ncbi:uncharacterized protein FIESC28_03400 [Fusarium coffeatum]|uniref:Uncharacterized protein n=1 Tax=Fusarium coffeatum TaxID=231269 RepID=A0A366S394_9HYPO|nr:uncharacterized protein FIESC28_03400 [Fusarium coffeatum]RBR23784.1 hypothetical protein FIESC28_03400 [Fusarium coffeatum]